MRGTGLVFVLSPRLESGSVSCSLPSSSLLRGPLMRGPSHIPVVFFFPSPARSLQLSRGGPGYQALSPLANILHTLVGDLLVRM